MKEDSLYALSLQEKVSLMRAANGLHLSGQTYYRPDNAFGFDEDDAYSVYHAKFQAEIGWNYFESSLFKRSGKTRELEIEGKLNKVLSEGTRLDEHYSLLKNRVSMAHDSIISALLQCRLENLKLLQHSRQLLLKHRKIGGDMLLEIMNQRSSVENKLSRTGIAHSTVGHLCPIPPSILQVDTVMLFRDMDGLSVDIEALRLKEELLVQRIDNASYWENVSIRPFARYSHYIRSGFKNSSNVDLGISFRFPLSLENRRKKKAMAAERNIQSLQTENLCSSVKTSTMLLIDDIERCNQTCLSEYSLIREMYQCILDRKSGYADYKGGYSFPGRLQEYNIYLEALERLQEVLRERDLLLVDLQRLYPNRSILDFCKYKSL